MSSASVSANNANVAVNIKPSVPPSRVTVRVDTNGVRVVNARGYELKIAASPSTEGFSAYELLTAALGVCSSLNLRREIKEAGIADAVPYFELEVHGTRGDSKPLRLERVDVVATIPGNIDIGTKASALHRAEQACTVANTLRNPVTVAAKLAD